MAKVSWCVNCSKVSKCPNCFSHVNKKKSQNPDQLVLYSYWRSSCSYRVRIALNLKGLQYEYRTVSILKKDEREKQLEEVNPYEQVPVLLVTDSDGKERSLIQSLAIIQYLDEVYPEPNPLLPSDPWSRGQVRAISDCIASGIQPLQNLGVLDMIKEKGGDHIRWAHDVISSRFSDLEKILKDTAGKCCVGDNVTMADLCLVPQVFNAKRFGVDMDNFALITRINAHLESMPEFAAAHPDRMPDAPSKQ